jgi:hypothetical protein
MSTYAVSELVKEVKVILDRNQELSALVPDDSDTLAQGEIIQSKLVDAARIIEGLAPVNMLDSVSTSSIATTWTLKNDAYVGVATLPSTILRLIRVKASDWERPADIILETDDVYRLQSNQYMRGNTQKPIVALAMSGTSRTLELYTSNSNSATVSISYVSVPTVNNSNIELCSLLKDAIMYMAAYLTCITLGDDQTAAGYKAIAYQLADIVEPSQS